VYCVIRFINDLINSFLTTREKNSVLFRKHSLYISQHQHAGKNAKIIGEKPATNKKTEGKNPYKCMGISYIRYDMDERERKGKTIKEMTHDNTSLN
jgi:hypothetical protein